MFLMQFILYFEDNGVTGHITDVLSYVGYIQNYKYLVHK